MENKDLLVIANSSKTASEVMSFVADRQRNTVYTAFSGLRADMKKKFGHPVNRVEFDETFKQLEAAKAGKLDRSKRGVCLGFYWSIPIRQLGTLIKNTDEVGKAVETIALVKAGQEALETRRNATVVILRRNGEAKTIRMSEARLKELDL